MTTATNDHIPELPVSPRSTILFGMVVVVLFIGSFVLWAVFAPLAEAVVASGTIKVDSSRKKIQHLEGGIVKEILVKDGDRVKQGDVLVRLDETRSGASLAILRDGNDSALAQEARLLAERDELEKIMFPVSLTTRSDQPNVEGILKSQVIVWEARRSALEGEVMIRENQIDQLRGDIDGYKAQIDSRQQQWAFLQEELSSLRDLYKKGLNGKQRLLGLEREASEIEGAREDYQSQIVSAETSIARKELEIYQVGKNFREALVGELKQVQAEIYDFRERLNAAEHVFSQSEVRAPVDGIVVSSGVHTISGVITPGGTLLELVPVHDSLIVEARINPQDIDKVRVGLAAAIKLTAFNQRTTPELIGELQYVSADSLQDTQSGMIYFLARIEVTDQEIKRLGDKQLQPGMMAEVFIRTGERTMAEYLLQPLRDSFRRAWLEE
jgi:HlyD family type I secretion membrane fusion protein